MITIRPAQALDASEIAPIMLLAMEEIVYYFIGQQNRSVAIRFLQRFIAQPNNQYSYSNIWIAVENNEILGQICLYDGKNLPALRQPIFDYRKIHYNQEIILESETQEGEVYLDTIAVSENAQGKGVGKKLLLHAIDEYVNKRKQTLGLLVDKDNPDAKKLYLKIGFKIIGQRRIFQKEMEHLQYAPS